MLKSSPTTTKPGHEASISECELDRILALQLLVAWAGEGSCEPPRLGWWRTDLVDRAGVAGLLQDLLPKTWRWAALEAARQAAILVDRQSRQPMADSAEVRTLFRWGFAVDEKLEERLLAHKQALANPGEVLDLPLAFEERFDPERLTTILEALGEVETQIAPDGRELLHVSAAPVERAEALTAALLPLANSWPMPFYRAGGPA